MNYCVYLIECILDGKKYVGYTSDPDARWIEHQASSRRKRCCTYLHRALAKHGIENFRFSVIENCVSIDHGLQREIFWIKNLSTFAPNGYNMTEGGDGLHGYKHTEETKRKMSELRKGKHLSEFTKQKLSKLGKGRVKSPETCERISKGKKGRDFTDAHRLALKEAWILRRKLCRQMGGRPKKKEIL